LGGWHDAGVRALKTNSMASVVWPQDGLSGLLAFLAPEYPRKVYVTKALQRNIGMRIQKRDFMMLSMDHGCGVRRTLYRTGDSKLLAERQRDITDAGKLKCPGPSRCEATLLVR